MSSDKKTAAIRLPFSYTHLTISVEIVARLQTVLTLAEKRCSKSTATRVGRSEVRDIVVFTKILAPYGSIQVLVAVRPGDSSTEVIDLSS